MADQIEEGSGITLHGVSAAWGDQDNDGRLDLFVANGCSNTQQNGLYWNEGPEGFRAVTSGPLVDEARPSLGVALGNQRLALDGPRLGGYCGLNPCDVAVLSRRNALFS